MTTKQRITESDPLDFRPKRPTQTRQFESGNQQTSREQNTLQLFPFCLIKNTFKQKTGQIPLAK